MADVDKKDWVKLSTSQKIYSIILLGFPVIVGLTAYVFAQKHLTEIGALGKFKIPPYQQLKEVKGILEKPLVINKRVGSWKIGQLLINNSNILAFSCLPNGNDILLSCVTSHYKDADVYNSKVIILKYFIMSKLFYPPYSREIVTPRGAYNIVMPRTAAAIAMEVTVLDGDKRVRILSYSDSVSRLTRYMVENPGM